MRLVVRKIAPPLLLKADMQPSELSLAVEILACIRKVLGLNLGTADRSLKLA
jgi:hypothetical protein